MLMSRNKPRRQELHAKLPVADHITMESVWVQMEVKISQFFIERETGKEERQKSETRKKNFSLFWMLLHALFSDLYSCFL